MDLNLFINMLTPIKKQGDEHICILLQFDIIDWVSVGYVNIRRLVWMLISSEITRDYQRLPEFTCGEALSIPRLLLRLGVGFRLSLYHAENSDDFFDLVLVSDCSRYQAENQR